jgi:hypothetical protein
MIVRKIRGQNKVGKIILTRTQIEMVRKMGISIEKYVKTQLVMIAKRRRWKWYFNKENT